MSSTNESSRSRRSRHLSKALRCILWPNEGPKGPDPDGLPKGLGGLVNTRVQMEGVSRRRVETIDLLASLALKL